MNRDVIGLACPPIEVVRIGFIGLGQRGMLALERYLHIEGVQVVALCDMNPYNLQKAKALLPASTVCGVVQYDGIEGWRQLCRHEAIDLVYICTDWSSHCEMALFAMTCGHHVAVEVPIAMTVEDCWRLVDMAEKTRKHCMMLENCCYDAYALTTLNMAKAKALGTLTHAEGAYIHDLRSQYLGQQGACNPHWMLSYSEQHNGNIYPTHGLGPICQWFDIHRTDSLDYLVSLSSREAGLSEYAERRNNKETSVRTTYEMGDVNTTLIRTMKGRSIVLQYDVVTPRPYSRHQRLCGTKGFIEKYPEPCALLEEWGNEALKGEHLEKLLNGYTHDFTREIGAIVKEKNLPNEMNFIMDYRLIHCLRKGLPLDMDVYDAVEWSCIAALSELSVRGGSIPVKIPDFTRGRWRRPQQQENCSVEKNP